MFYSFTITHVSVAQTVLRLAVRTPLKAASDTHHLFFNISLLSGINIIRRSGLILYSLCSDPGISHLSSEVPIPFSRK